MRSIKLANAQKRDAEIVYGGTPKKPRITYLLPDGKKARTQKVLKSVVETQYSSLLSSAGSDENLVEQIINGDPEISLKHTGKFINNSQKILVNEALKPVYKVKITELVYSADGSLKEEKPYIVKSQNIMGEYPLSWTGKKFAVDEVYNKFIFARKYQLTHSNGLTYDFLYAMAKELSESKSMMLLAGGAKGNEPLIFQEGGKPYRAFLEGRINGDSYLLIIHISNLELKSIL